jgi:hypothetical protein
LLNRLEEQHTPIAKQLALVLAKITRNDWPELWPELFPSLMMSVQQGGEVRIAKMMQFCNNKAVAPICFGHDDAVSTAKSSSVPTLRRKRNIFQEDRYFSQELPG